MPYPNLKSSTVLELLGEIPFAGEPRKSVYAPIRGFGMIIPFVELIDINSIIYENMLMFPIEEEDDYVIISERVKDDMFSHGVGHFWGDLFKENLADVLYEASLRLANIDAVPSSYVNDRLYYRVIV